MRIDVSRLTARERRAFERAMERELASLPDAGPPTHQEDALRSTILAAEYEAETGHAPAFELTIPGVPTNYDAWLRRRHEREDEEDEVEAEAERQARAEPRREIEREAHDRRMADTEHLITQRLLGGR